MRPECAVIWHIVGHTFRYIHASPGLQSQCPSNSDLPTNMIGYSAEIQSQIEFKSGITHCCTIIGHTNGYIRLDNVTIPGCLSINIERFTLVLLWVLETLGYSMGNRKYASEYAMKYAMPRYHVVWP